MLTTQVHHLPAVQFGQLINLSDLQLYLKKHTHKTGIAMLLLGTVVEIKAKRVH